MDTTERRNGKYFFDGMRVDKEELPHWLILDEFKKQFSDVIDLLAIASMLVSLPVIPVRGKLGADMATKGTSPLSLALRSVIRQRFKTGRRTITWAKLLRGEWAYTTSIGAYIGRWLPWVGAVLTAYHLAMITQNVIHRYKLIVASGER
ncbi:STM2901 family protein [Cronobacter dublinensis]